MDNQKLIFGDCLDILPSLEGGVFDMVLADLPYGTTRNSWDSVIDLDRLWPELLRVTKPGAAIVMTAQQPFTSLLVMSQPKLFRHHWIWEKTNATGYLNAKRAPMKAHEDVLVFATKQPTYNPQKTHGHERKTSTRRTFTATYGKHDKVTSYDSTERYPRSVQVFSLDKQKSKLHTTQKPVALFEYLIRTYSNPGDLILDPAAGSGTTGVAAFNTGRWSIMIENDIESFVKARDRLSQ